MDDTSKSNEFRVIAKAEITPASLSAPGFQCGDNIAVAGTGQHGALQHHKVVSVFVSKRIPNGLTRFEDITEGIATVGIARCGNADKRSIRPFYGERRCLSSL